METQKNSYILSSMLAIILLLLALFDLPYGYYNFLRIMIFIISCYSIYVFYKYEKILWVWIFVIIAVLFNPIIPIYLDKSLWKIVDIVAVIIFLISFIFNKKNN